MLSICVVFCIILLGGFMNRKYLVNSIILFVLLLVDLFGIIVTTNENLSLMLSIMFPILFSLLVDIGIKQKRLYMNYYEKLYMYLRTYQDIFEQTDYRIPINEKRKLIQLVVRDAMSFLHDNVSYASDNTCDLLEVNLLYQYEYKLEYNSIQDFYNFNYIMPYIIDEIIENYNFLHILGYIFKKHYFKKNIYYKCFGLYYVYVDLKIIDLLRANDIVISMDELLEAYKKIDIFRNTYYMNYYNMYKYLKYTKIDDKKKLFNDFIKTFDTKKIAFKKIK